MRPSQGIDTIINNGLCLALTAVLAAGCMHESSRSCNPSAPASRVIVKFVDSSRTAPENVEVQTPDGATANLRRERAMSGATELYRTCATREQLAVIIHALNQRPDVRYAEADRKLRF